MKNKKGNVVLIGVIIVVVAISVGIIGWMFTKKVQSPTQPEVANQTVIPTTTITPTTQTQPKDEMTSWQAYRNEKYGIEFQYQKEWGPISAETERKAISGTGEEFYILFANSKLNVSGVTSNFVPWEGSSPYKGNDPMSYCKETEKNKVILNGCNEISNNKVSVTYGYYSDMGGLYLVKEVFIKNSGNKYSGITLSYRFDSDDSGFGYMSKSQEKTTIENQLKKIDQSELATFDKIISTFKFIK